MFISEYRLFNKKQRESCDLREYSEIIEDTVKKIVPGVIVGVGKERYLVIGKERLTREQAREIGKELFKHSSLSEWKGYNGDNPRLMERCNELKLSNSIIRKLYHIIEEEEQNE